MKVHFRTNLDEAQKWLQYLSAWDNNVIPPIGSEIVIKHPAYDCHLTLGVCGHRFVVEVKDPNRYEYPRSEGAIACEVELNIPRFLHSIAQWEEWYKRHFK